MKNCQKSQTNSDPVLRERIDWNHSNHFRKMQGSWKGGHQLEAQKRRLDAIQSDSSGPDNVEIRFVTLMRTGLNDHVHAVDEVL